MRKFQYPNCKLQTNTNNETLNTKQIQIHNFQNQYCIFRYCLEFRISDLEFSALNAECRKLYSCIIAIMKPPKKLPKFLKTEYEPPPEPRPAPPPKKVYETIPKLIRHNYDQGADDIAMCQKKFGIWKKYPWRKYYEVVGQLSLGLISLGLKLLKASKNNN